MGKKDDSTARTSGTGVAVRPLPDWDKLVFSFSQTDEIYCASGSLDNDPVWEPGEFRAHDQVSLAPSAGCFSYGIGIFEGLKAQRTPDGRVLVFRHRDNARRFQASAGRLMMAPFPEDRFVEAIEETVRRNLRFVPPHGMGSFYLRPMEHGIEPQLGIRPSRRFWVLIYGCPVGGYFAGGPRPDDPGGLRLRVLEQGRVAPGGTGSAKAIGNYAGGLALSMRCKAEGFTDALYLDARHVTYLTETTGANVFVRVRSGVLVTPPLDDQILPGVTRDSVIRLAREELGVRVEERSISIDEAQDAGIEMFCTGTAYTVQSVREIVYRERPTVFSSRELQQAVLERLLGIQRGLRDDPYGWTTEI